MFSIGSMGSGSRVCINGMNISFHDGRMYVNNRLWGPVNSDGSPAVDAIKSQSQPALPEHTVVVDRGDGCTFDVHIGTAGVETLRVGGNDVTVNVVNGSPESVQCGGENARVRVSNGSVGYVSGLGSLGQLSVSNGSIGGVH